VLRLTLPCTESLSQRSRFDGVKVASFAEGRIGYREWALGSGRLEYIHSLDDRYDHDIDELLG
jgi:hypothetical protein